MAVVLTLGGVLFADFEVPEDINFGGLQELVVQKLPGGARVIDAMGRDDADIRWSGRFRGSDAEIRARQLDFIRIQGQVVELVWSSFRYQVLVKSFDAKFQQSYEIPYSVSCLVVMDETSPIVEAILGIDNAIGTDLNQVVQVASIVNIPAVSSAISGLQSATSVVGTFQGAAATDVAGVQAAISAAQSVTGTAITSNNAIVAPSGSVAGVVAGGSPTDLAASLTNQAGSFANLGNLYQIQSSLGRMATNVANGGN